MIIATVDAEGLICPLPVLRLRKALQALNTGQQIILRSTDPIAVIDVPAFCQQEGHELVATETEGSVSIFTVQKGTA